MRYIDISLPVAPGMAAYPGDPEVRLDAWTSVAQGAEYNVSALALGSHAGTHVDAPRHCFTAGTPVDALPLARLCGPARVMDVPAGAAPATLQRLIARLPRACTRLLLRTREGRGWEESSATHGPGLDEHTAQALIARDVRLVGIDRLSIAEGEATLPVHRLLLQHGIVIIEGLDLQHAPPGAYRLLCLPLRLAGCDGAPARVVLTRRPDSHTPVPGRGLVNRL